MKDGNKKYIYIGILIMLAVLECNTNNNPNSFLLRIFRPIVQGESSCYYGNTIAIIVMYICLDKVWTNTKWEPLRRIDHYLHPFIRKIIIIGLFAVIVETAGESGIQIYKGFQNNLDAIYLQRKNSNVSYAFVMYGYNGVELPEKVIGVHQEVLGVGKEGRRDVIVSGAPEGYIVLENCSSKSIGPFKIRLVAECNLEDHLIKSNIKTNLKLKSDAGCEMLKEYVLGPKEVKKINIENEVFEEDFFEQIDSSITHKVKIILEDQDEECIFEYKY